MVFSLLAAALGMQMSAEMSLELQTQATLQMMAEEVPVTTDPDLHDKMSCPMSKVRAPSVRARALPPAPTHVPAAPTGRSHPRARCPTGTQVGCPLCYNIVENWNLERKLPAHADTYCSDVVTEQWKAMYQTLTGKPFINMREKTRVRARLAPQPCCSIRATTRTPPRAHRLPNLVHAVCGDRGGGPRDGDAGLHAGQLLTRDRVLHVLLREPHALQARRLHSASACLAPGRFVYIRL